MKTPGLYMDGRLLARFEQTTYGGELVPCAPNVMVQSVHPFRFECPDRMGWSELELLRLLCHTHGAKPHHTRKVMVRRLQRVFDGIAKDERRWQGHHERWAYLAAMQFEPCARARAGYYVDQNLADDLSAFNEAQASSTPAPGSSPENTGAISGALDVAPETGAG